FGALAEYQCQCAHSCEGAEQCSLRAARSRFDGRNEPLRLCRKAQQNRRGEVGIADATSFEVVSGLTQDDLVALPGDTELRDGMPVKIISTADNLVRGQKSED